MKRRVLFIALVGVAISLIASQSSSANDGSGYFAGGTTAPVMNAGLYPMPVQTVPPRIGGTFITNPALYPHEFLYAHQHHYLAPPFYHIRKSHPFSFFSKHKGDCCEACSRCGSCDCNGNCILRGTEITVRYRSKRSWFHTHFLPPR